MPTATAGIYELIFNQLYSEQVVKNVFHYLHTLGNDDEQVLCAQAFDEDVVSALADVQNTLVDYTDIRVRNLTGVGADAVLIPTLSNGALVGIAVTTFMSTPFRYNRATKDTRNGAKRLAGLTEEVITSTGFTVPFFAQMGATAVTLGTEISTVGGIFTPIILRRQDSPPGTFTYSDVASVSPLNRSTTQNSRKVF